MKLATKQADAREQDASFKLVTNSAHELEARMQKMRSFANTEPKVCRVKDGRPPVAVPAGTMRPSPNFSPMPGNSRRTPQSGRSQNLSPNARRGVIGNGYPSKLGRAQSPPHMNPPRTPSLPSSARPVVSTRVSSAVGTPKVSSARLPQGPAPRVASARTTPYRRTPNVPAAPVIAPPLINAPKASDLSTTASQPVLVVSATPIVTPVVNAPTADTRTSQAAPMVRSNSMPLVSTAPALPQRSASYHALNSQAQPSGSMSVPRGSMSLPIGTIPALASAPTGSMSVPRGSMSLPIGTTPASPAPTGSMLVPRGSMSPTIGTPSASLRLSSPTSAPTGAMSVPVPQAIQCSSNGVGSAQVPVEVSSTLVARPSFSPVQVSATQVASSSFLPVELSPKLVARPSVVSSVSVSPQKVQTRLVSPGPSPRQVQEFRSLSPCRDYSRSVSPSHRPPRPISHLAPQSPCSSNKGSWRLPTVGEYSPSAASTGSAVRALPGDLLASASRNLPLPMRIKRGGETGSANVPNRKIGSANTPSSPNQHASMVSSHRPLATAAGSRTAVGSRTSQSSFGSLTPGKSKGSMEAGVERAWAWADIYSNTCSDSKSKKT